MNLSPPNRLPQHSNRATPAKIAGIIAIGAALPAALIHPLASAVPLLLFLIICFTAPLLPGFSFFLPIVSRGRTDTQAVALTFDDGPDPVSTPALLDLLDRHRASATFYVTGKRAEQYPELIRQMVDRGHTVGNHSYRHDNLIMFKRSAALKDEIVKAQHVLRELGVFPATFRPPVGVTSPKLGPVLRSLGMYTVNFNRRAGDRGNRQISAISRKILGKLRAGDIIMLHDIPPRNGGTLGEWLNEVDRMLCGIEEKGLKVIPLAELIGYPVMAEGTAERTPV